MGTYDTTLEDSIVGRIALQRFGDVPPNFKLYKIEWHGVYPTHKGVTITGAVFIENCCTNSSAEHINIDTIRSTFISRHELKEYEKHYF